MPFAIACSHELNWHVQLSEKKSEKQGKSKKIIVTIDNEEDIKIMEVCW